MGGKYWWITNENVFRRVGFQDGWAGVWVVERNLDNFALVVPIDPFSSLFLLVGLNPEELNTRTLATRVTTSQAVTTTTSVKEGLQGVARDSAEGLE